MAFRETSLAGYYSPGADRIVFYNIESNPSLTDARDKLKGQCGCDLLFNYTGMHDMAESGTRDNPGIFFRFFGGQSLFLFRSKFIMLAGILNGDDRFLGQCLEKFDILLIEGRHPRAFQKQNT